MSISEGSVPTCIQYTVWLTLSQRTPLYQAPRGSRAHSYIQNSRMVKGGFFFDSRLRDLRVTSPLITIAGLATDIVA